MAAVRTVRAIVGAVEAYEPHGRADGAHVALVGERGDLVDDCTRRGHVDTMLNARNKLQKSRKMLAGLDSMTFYARQRGAVGLWGRGGSLQ